MCQWLHDCAIAHPAKQQSVNAANQRDRHRGGGSQLDWQPPKRLIYPSTYLPTHLSYLYNHSSVRRCVVLSICQHPVRFTFRDWFILYKTRLPSAHYANLLCAVCQRAAASVPDTMRYDTIRSKSCAHLPHQQTKLATQFQKRSLYLLCLLSDLSARW